MHAHTLYSGALSAEDRILSDPDLIAAEKRFFDVVTKLYLEDLDRRTQLALNRVGCTLLLPGVQLVLL
jgi:hypothetical protein